MTHCVQQKLPALYLEPSKITFQKNSLFIYCLKYGFALVSAMAEVKRQFVLCINAIWHSAGRIHFRERKWWRREEFLLACRKVQIKEKKGMESQIPELWMSRLVGPKIIRAIANCISQHVDRRSDLGPQRFSIDGQFHVPLLDKRYSGSHQRKRHGPDGPDIAKASHPKSNVR
jgi:hypothetical protein